MLKRLTVSNLAVVEKADASFEPGLNVITGETGAGKSVLMGALDLVLGGRADASIVRDGAKEAEVEAEFDNHLIRRTVTAQGRSRAWIDDESVTLAELKDVCRGLVDIHGPRANQLLLEEAFQRQTLDAFGNVELAEYSSAYGRLTELDAQRAALSAEGSEEEVDFLRYQVGELEGACLTDEDETLAARHAAAAHAEEIAEHAAALTEGLGGDESAAEMLMRLQPHFQDLARHVPQATEWATEAEELTARIQDLSRTVAAATSVAEDEGESLEALDARLTVVNRLARKYLKGPGENAAGRIARLLAIAEEKKARLDTLEHRDERLAELDARREKALAEVQAAGARLTAARRKAGETLSKRITRDLRDLGFVQAKFFVKLEAVEPEAHGMDRVVYMFEPNPGEAARPLAEIASSGEIARVMLAIKTVTAAQDAAPRTLVFDEIDANIGGEVGRVVGEKMRAVAAHHQVIAITHLPQSAVYGTRHLVVTKSVSGGRTRTCLTEVSGEDRVGEIARMLGGVSLTSVVKKHAKELLSLPH